MHKIHRILNNEGSVKLFPVHKPNCKLNFYYMWELFRKKSNLISLATSSKEGDGKMWCVLSLKILPI